MPSKGRCEQKQVWGHSTSPGAQVAGGREVTRCKHAFCGSDALASSKRRQSRSWPRWRDSQDPEWISTAPILHSSEETPGLMNWPQTEFSCLLSYTNPTPQAPWRSPFLENSMLSSTSFHHSSVVRMNSSLPAKPLPSSGLGWNRASKSFSTSSNRKNLTLVKTFLFSNFQEFCLVLHTRYFSTCLIPIVLCLGTWLGAWVYPLSTSWARSTAPGPKRALRPRWAPLNW